MKSLPQRQDLSKTNTPKNTIGEEKEGNKDKKQIWLRDI